MKKIMTFTGGDLGINATIDDGTELFVKPTGIYFGTTRITIIIAGSESLNFSVDAAAVANINTYIRTVSTIVGGGVT